MATDPRSQPELQFTEDVVEIIALPSRGEPSLWVKSMGVYADWKPCEANLLRSFQLRRGLNILWANPAGGEQSENRLSGHSAGKSTFCRLLRHVLGEPKAGTSEFLEGFRSRYRNGWLLGEVVVAGATWLVGRPMGVLGHHPFAFQSALDGFDFPDNPPRQGFQEYIAAIEQAVFPENVDRMLPDSQEMLTWNRVLPWLSRDQEAHYSGLLEWRHKDSDHESPHVSHDDRGHIVRLVLGVLESNEQELLSQHAAAARGHERLVRDRPREERIVETDRERLAKALEISDEDWPLIEQIIERRTTALRDSVDTSALAKRQETELAPLEAAVDAARFSHTLVASQIEDCEAMIELEQARIDGSKVPPPRAPSTDPHVQALRQLGPFPGFCSHEMTSAWRAQCPIAKERPKDPGNTGDAEAEIESETQESERRIGQLRFDLRNLQELAARRKVALDEAAGELRRIRHRHHEELTSHARPMTVAAEIESLYASYRTSSVALEEWDKEKEHFSQLKQDLDEQLARLARGHQQVMAEFQRIFNHVARVLLGEGVTASVRFKGKAIEPELHFNGVRNSAALQVAKWVAFDLASVVFSMVNEGSFHPRLLIHDSPREADLANIIYSELFHFARKLESEGESAFQYIITTTEPPPSELQKEPWLIDPVLDASKPESRLLGIDLDS